MLRKKQTYPGRYAEKQSLGISVLVWDYSWRIHEDIQKEQGRMNNNVRPRETIESECVGLSRCKKKWPHIDHG